MAALYRSVRPFTAVLNVRGCGEEELVRQVPTLFGRNAQVVYELQVQEEMERVRQEVREVEGESKARRNAHMNMNMWMG